VRTAGQRAADIVTNMLEFSRYGNPHRAWVDLVDLVEHALELAKPGFRTSAGERMQIVRHFPAQPFPKVPCSAAEIQQVLLNLLRNASQALREQPVAAGEPPTITVTIDSDGRDAIITVGDNGPGMDATVQHHIFDPFYTTKAVGQGTGLGLSISYFIIHEHHQGSLAVASEPGHGSRFEVRLPLQTPHDPPGI
jgi:signal transduction histidine kinase